jgi:hypothetical protein
MPPKAEVNYSTWLRHQALRLDRNAAEMIQLETGAQIMSTNSAKDTSNY